MARGLAFAVLFDLALDQGDGLQPGPIVALFEPVDIGDCPMAAEQIAQEVDDVDANNPMSLLRSAYGI